MAGLHSSWDRGRSTTARSAPHRTRHLPFTIPRDERSRRQQSQQRTGEVSMQTVGFMRRIVECGFRSGVTGLRQGDDHAEEGQAPPDGCDDLGVAALLRVEDNSTRLSLLCRVSGMEAEQAAANAQQNSKDAGRANRAVRGSQQTRQTTLPNKGGFTSSSLKRFSSEILSHRSNACMNHLGMGQHRTEQRAQRDNNQHPESAALETRRAAGGHNEHWPRTKPTRPPQGMAVDAGATRECL